MSHDTLTYAKTNPAYIKDGVYGVFAANAEQTPSRQFLINRRSARPLRPAAPHKLQRRVDDWFPN